MASKKIQFVSDENGKTVAVIVPIGLWNEIESEKETAYLLKSENMKRRLLKAKQRQGQSMALDDACEKLGL
jgi:antitoxin YefM